MFSFKEFISEAKGNTPDGVKFLDHRNVWVIYSGGKIIATKKTKESAEAYAAKKLSSTSTPAPEQKVAAPKVAEPDDSSDVPDSDEPEKIETPEFEIPVHNLDFFQKKIDKLNKIAAKLKCKPIEVTKSEVFSKKIGFFRDEDPGNPDHPNHNQDGTAKIPRYMDFVKVKVTGEAPKLAGWSFIGKREPLEGSDAILAKTAPGSKMPAKFSDDHDLTCDHCKKRARRVATFVVKKGRKYMEVGRSCLKDFLGHNDPNNYASYAEMLYDLNKSLGDMGDDNYMGGRGRFVPTFETKSIVAAALHSIREKGFVSSQYGSDTKTPTSYLINQHFNPPIPMPRGLNYEDHFKIKYTPKDEAEAEKIIEWMKTHSKAGKEEFWTNISKIAKAETTGLKMTGYLAAGVNSHQKEAGLIKKTDGIMKTLKKDEGVGEVDKKIDVMATVISSFAYQSNGMWGGTKHIITAKTDSGHLIKMFTSSGDSGVKKDARVNIIGKIGKVEPETYDKSPFKGMMVTTMAPRSRIESVLTDKEADEHFHVGDKVKFRREGKADGIGIITAKPVYGRFEVSPVSGRKGEPIHVKHEDMISKV